ncbi:MAG TPA: PilZ domain-containing protein [Allosphingosinicella sp.]|nr:PilZ domain-containing protein [Allosphingosinicella sp.]
MVIQAQLIPDLDGAEPRRRAPRVGAPADMAMRKLGTTAVDARLINISSHGFMAETRAAIEPGVRVWLCLPGLPRVNALVLWARGSKLGGEFAAPIDPLVVLQAIGQAAGGGQS